MKEIKLTELHITPNRKGKGYCVHLGNGTSNTFTSKADAKTFIGSTNNFLDRYFHELHILYKDVLVKYQDNWFNFKSPRTNKKEVNLHLKEEFIYQHLTNAERALTLAHERSHHTNGNYFVFVHLFNVAEALEEVIRALAEISNLKNNRNEVFTLDSYLSRKQVIHNFLDTYAKYSTTRYFKVPTHITQDRSWKPDFTHLKIVA